MKRVFEHIGIFLIVLLSIFNTYGVYAQNGKINGRIFDKTNNEPLPFANIIVDGTTIGTTSDLNGNFIITGLEPGFIRLRASYLGYDQSLSPEIQITNASIANVEITMEENRTLLDEIVVKVSPFRKSEESPVSLQRIGISEIEGNPGSNRDISRVIQSFPGVGSTVSYRNDIIIRGGGPNESRFYLDDVEIPNINHFATQGASGGPVGMLNADFISSVNYYSGAFPASRSNALSGVFEFSQTDGNSDKLKFRGSLGASELSLTADGPLGNNTGFIFSARQSYLQFLFDAIGLPFLPTFNDYQLKIRSRINQKNEIKIISIGALDKFKLNTGIKNPTEDQEYILTQIPVYEQWNYAIGLVYKHYRENSFQTIVLSRNMLDNTAYKYPENNESLPKILDYNSQEIENKVRYETTGRLYGFKYVYSINAEYAKYINKTYRVVYTNDQLSSIDYYSYLELFKWGASVQMSKNIFKDRLSLSFGLRTDANNYSASMNKLFGQLSPRFSASYLVLPKLSINANTGRYYQLPAYTTLGYRSNSGILQNKENNLEYISVDHYIGGFEYRLKPAIIFTMEGFYKHYSDYPFSTRDSISLANKGGDYGVVGDEEVTSTGNGRAYGFEITNRTKMEKFNLIFAYTYVRSEFTDKNNEYIPSAWDSKHLLAITATKDFKKGWSGGLKWRYAGALPYTPFGLETSAIKEAWDASGGVIPDYNLINAARLNAFHQLDIRIDKKYFFNKWTLMFYLDIQNLYNFKAKLPDNYVREKDENGDYLSSADNTRYILKPIKNESGTILPTLGIMVEF